MLLPDVNILVAAFREDATDYVPMRAWLEAVVNGDEPFGLSSLVFSGFLRIVTNPRVYRVPTPPEEAIAFVEDIRGQAGFREVRPGPRHWDIFVDLSRGTGARGNLVPDAYFAALAIESGNEWVTMDRGFARFPGLRWRRPF